MHIGEDYEITGDMARDSAGRIWVSSDDSGKLWVSNNDDQRIYCIDINQ